MKKILFLFMLIIILIPLHVKGEEMKKESAKGYTSSIVDGKYIYKFGDGTTLSYPSEIRIKDIFFNMLDLIETAIPKEQLKIQYAFNIETVTTDYDTLYILYKDVRIIQGVYIDIKEYIYIPEEITVNEYEFNIMDYVKTNLNRDDIEIVGEYDLNTNGKYGLIIRCNEIIEKTILIVDIEDNKEKVENTCPEIDMNEKEEIQEDKKEEILTYETKNYISNYYTYNTEEVKDCVCPEIKIPTPINKVIYTNKENNDLFYYISYVFYGLVIILLSINVVRKK